jgi:hypothetical protein
VVYLLYLQQPIRRRRRSRWCRSLRPLLLEHLRRLQ